MLRASISSLSLLEPHRFSFPVVLLLSLCFIFHPFTFALHQSLEQENQKPLLTSFHSHMNHGPGANIQSCRQNANLIFNSIHSALRQWPSSIQHNGMSFFPATIPEGTLLYHGAPSQDRINGMEWLALEIPYGELFARQPISEMLNDDANAENYSYSSDQKDKDGLVKAETEGTGSGPYIPLYPPTGYLHIYQATRPLRLLYLDGMSAANCILGTLDTQDHLLLTNFTGGIMGEWPRAQELCSFVTSFGYEGIIRMEIGFEIIKCDFNTGLDYISHYKRPDTDVPEGDNSRFLFDLLRDISGQYGGIDGERIVLDYGGMVSVGFYEANFTNPDSSVAELPRLVSTDRAVLSRVREDVQAVFKRLDEEREGMRNGINWQHIADMIVKRYSVRLLYLASEPPYNDFLAEMNQLLNLYLDYEHPNVQNPVQSCSRHFLRPVRMDVATEQDRLIMAAIESTMTNICGVLFEAREILLSKAGCERYLGEEKSTAAAAALIRELNAWLNWTSWKTCGRQCEIDEVCFIAMFPLGSIEDHYHPRCVNNTEMQKHDFDFDFKAADNTSYWMRGISWDGALGSDKRMNERLWKWGRLMGR
jgi:hypothetical protein